MNHLEALIAEWLEYRGYFVRRNVRVGKLVKGGYEGDLDVVAFHPKTQCLVHYETSTDASSWEERERRFARKFEVGRKYIPTLFPGVVLSTEPVQIALLTVAGEKHKTIGGGKVLTTAALLDKIQKKLRLRPFAKGAVSENYPNLRTIQLLVDSVYGPSKLKKK